MLAQSQHHLLWLREQDHPAISWPKWQQQLSVLGEFYQAETCLIVQFIDNSFQVVCARKGKQYQLIGGTHFEDAGLQSIIEDHNGYTATISDGRDLSSSLNQFKHLLTQPIFWPDGELFGSILICDPDLNKQAEPLSYLIENSKSFIQAELKHLFLMQQIKMLSVQDDQTCMLNPYGFSLMAPRQLSLSRRFGSHAGIILIEENIEENIEESSSSALTCDSQAQKRRLLARIIHDNMRDADVSARISHNQFIILCFIDHKANLDSLVSRLKKQIAKEALGLTINTGQSFFTPDTQISLEPMKKQANDNLNLNKLGSANNF
ncbi:GGDEF domain-containing protein [Shewanella woodyi]|uniref:GGDEF domain-containing protein n=1 Tax=Shewanella woodyi TaxID=60961 RepID=UPI0037478486